MAHTLHALVRFRAELSVGGVDCLRLGVGVAALSSLLHGAVGMERLTVENGGSSSPSRAPHLVYSNLFNWWCSVLFFLLVVG